MKEHFLIHRGETDGIMPAQRASGPVVVVSLSVQFVMYVDDLMVVLVLVSSVC